MKLLDRMLFYPTPGQGVMARSFSCYTGCTGGAKMRMDHTITIDEYIRTLQRAFSSNHGETWSAPEPLKVKEPAEGGLRRWHVYPGFVDLATDRLLTMVMEGVLPEDEPFAAIPYWTVSYRVSLDGGHTNVVDEPVIGEGCTPEHPFDGVSVGRVAMIIGDMTTPPISTRGGKIVVPVNLTVTDPDGRFANLGKSSIYLVSAVLIGEWMDDCRIHWELSERVSIDPARSSRGCLEPTIAQAPDGRLLMVMRGSNDSIDHPGVKWFSVSRDEGRTWTPPEPWTFSDGSTLFSPSSSSQLFQHSDGTLYWLGNVSPENPQGSYPRYPLVIGRVDPANLKVVRDSVFEIDSWQPEDGPLPVMLSSFYAHEDRRNGHILVHLSRVFRLASGEYPTGDAFLYRLEP